MSRDKRKTRINPDVPEPDCLICLAPTLLSYETLTYYDIAVTRSEKGGRTEASISVQNEYSTDARRRQNRIARLRLEFLLPDQSNLIWLKRISLSQRWVAMMCRMVPDFERMTTLAVRAPEPK